MSRLLERLNKEMPNHVFERKEQNGKSLVMCDGKLLRTLWFEPDDEILTKLEEHHGIDGFEELIGAVCLDVAIQLGEMDGR